MVGGDAAGMSAASQALRRAEPGSLQVIAFERTGYTSYSACGIPYWLAGELGADKGPEVLVVRSPERHRRNGIDVRTRTEVVALDVERQEVLARPADGDEYRVPFDELVVATGAVPIRPELPGIGLPGIDGVQTLQDGTAVLDSLRDQPERAVVVGAGYIGLEMAEAMVRRGLSVTVVEQAPEPMSTLDPDMGALVAQAMGRMGIGLHANTTVVGFRAGPDGRVRRGRHRRRRAACPAGRAGDRACGRTPGWPGRLGCRWAGPAGCAPIDGCGCSGTTTCGPGVTASRSRTESAASRCTSRSARTPTSRAGSIGDERGRRLRRRSPAWSAPRCSKICDLEVARTGLSRAPGAAGRVRVRTPSQSSRRPAPGTCPDAAPVTVKLLAELGSGRLLGAQIVGRAGRGEAGRRAARRRCAPA